MRDCTRRERLSRASISCPDNKEILHSNVLEQEQGPPPYLVGEQVSKKTDAVTVENKYESFLVSPVGSSFRTNRPACLET